MCVFSCQNVRTGVNHILRCEECTNFHAKSEGDFRRSCVNHRLQNYESHAWRHSYVGEAMSTVSVRHNAIPSTQQIKNGFTESRKALRSHLFTVSTLLIVD
jgi:hypothetical protein